MSSEELKLIIDAIRSLSGDTKEAFIWWLVATQGAAVLTTLIAWLCGIAMVIGAYKAIRHIASLIAGCTWHSSESLRLASAYGVEWNSYVGWKNTRDIDSACALLRAAQEKTS